MTNSRRLFRDADSYNWCRVLCLVMATGATVHCMLLLYDLADPGAFLRVDRGSLRLQRILGVGETSSLREFVDYLGSQGLVGDWAFHAALFLPGGRFAVIGAQVLLLLASAAAVFRLCELLTFPPHTCAVATAVYLLLPHSVVFPHQLSSEAAYTPMLVLSTYMTVWAHQQRSTAALVASGLLLGIATLVRPVTLLWPLIVGTTLAALWKPTQGIRFVVAAYVPVLLWMTLVAHVTGDFGLGESNASMGRNLYQRVNFISSTMPEGFRREVQTTLLNRGNRGELSLSEYMAFARQYPVPVAKHIAHDAAAFFVKSGVEKLTIDYLGGGETFFDLKNDRGSSWRDRLQQEGPFAAAAYLWERLGAVFVISVLGALFMVCGLLLAAIGAVSLIAARATLPSAALLGAFLVIMLPAYLFAASQVVDVMQSRLRAPAEFALVVLAAHGAFATINRRRASTALPGPIPAENCSRPL